MKKAGMLCLIIMTVLLAMGVGYAGWADSVALIEDLNTGLLMVGLRSSDLMYCRQEVYSGAPQGYESGNAFSLNCTDGTYLFELRGQRYYDMVYVTVFTHPRFSPYCHLEIANGGTLPASIEAINVRLGSRVTVGDWEMTLPGGYQESGSGLGPLQAAIRKTLEPEQTMSLKMRLCSNSKHPGFAAGNISVAYSHFNGTVPGGNAYSYSQSGESGSWTPFDTQTIPETTAGAGKPEPDLIPAASGNQPDFEQPAETQVPADNPPAAQESAETTLPVDTPAEIIETSETSTSAEISAGATEASETDSSDGTQSLGDETPSSSSSGTAASGSAETSSSGAASSDASGSAETSSSGAASSDASGSAETSSSGAASSDASGSAETSSSGAASSDASGSAETSSSGAASSDASGSAETAAE